MDVHPAPPHEACYTARVYRREMQFVRDHPELARAARKCIGDLSGLLFVAATISNASGERFIYVTIERESRERVVWVKVWWTETGPATAIVMDRKIFQPAGRA